MPILKSQPEPARPLLKDAVVLDLGDLGRQAAQLKAAAEAKAERIIADAQAEADRLTAGAEQTGLERGLVEGRTQGEAAGREAGHAAALAEGAEVVQQVTERLAALAEQWEARRQELDRQAREAVLDLALRIARKVVHRTAEIDRQVVVEQVGHALERVLEPTDVTIRVHPDDRPTLDEVLPDMLARFSHLDHVKVADDEAVGLGGCVLEAGEGRVDASLDTQLQRIAELVAPGFDDAAES